eukprot:688781-Rhodomonas_salina.1
MIVKISVMMTVVVLTYRLSCYPGTDLSAMLLPGVSAKTVHRIWKVVPQYDRFSTGMLSCYAFAMRYPVLTSPMVLYQEGASQKHHMCYPLRARDAMSGTHIRDVRY